MRNAEMMLPQTKSLTSHPGERCWAWLQTEFGSDPQLDVGLRPEARETLSLRSLSSRLSLPLSKVEQREVKLQVRSAQYAVKGRLPTRLLHWAGEGQRGSCRR